MEEKTNIKEINSDEVRSKLKDKGKSKNDKSEAWTSGIKVLTKIDIIVPLKLLLVCNQLAENEKIGDDEFSIVTNILERDDTEITLDENYYIPRQEVSHSSIDYLPDDCEGKSYNVVIHRHPDGCNSFSSTDREFINQNYELSLLYTKRDGFINGIYNLKHDNGYLIQLPVQIFVDYGIQEINIENIQKPAPLVVFHKKPRNRKDKFRNSDATFDIDLDRIEKEDKKFLLEEKLDYALLKDILLEEVTEQIQGMEYRLDNIEDMVFHQSSFASHGSPF